ncbi:MAG TPA: c-type cytochrome, partial [Verrucomicrobiae bacterium]|nr:c-type cytochrome [Verrucomicrobiae bacterium]
QIFGTTAKQISGLARVRTTGLPSTLPREVIPMEQGILIKFDVALDARKAVDPANYSIERWNYKRTPDYGSPHFKLDGTKGQEVMAASSAYLSRDGKSVFVGIRDLKAVMQMRVGWALATKEGVAFGQNAYFTPHEFVRFVPEKEVFAPMTVDLAPRTIAASTNAPVSVVEGRRVAELYGCAACHSTDGSTIGKVGPTWKGLSGGEVKLAGGGHIVADEAYLRESIREPSAKMVRGYEKSDVAMPAYEGLLSDTQLESLLLYIKSLR